MLLWVLNILYVLIALAMIVLILMQRGSGAAAGASFGGGASSTVFGSRGSANFLSKSTKWLAVVFFSMTLGMAWMHMQGARQAGQLHTDLGVMGQAAPANAAPNAAPAPAIPSVPSVPAAPAPEQAVPAAPEAQNAGEKTPQEN